jgi:hypothetical protein
MIPDVQLMRNFDLPVARQGNVDGVRQFARKNIMIPDVQLMRNFDLPVARQGRLFHMNRVHETASHLSGRQLFAHCRSSHLPGFGPEDDL